jgi:hypothetical protein
MPVYSPIGDPTRPRVLPSNVPEWPRRRTARRTRVLRVLKLLMGVAVIGGLLAAAQTFVGLDQVERWLAAPSLPTLPARDLPESRNWAGYTASSGHFSAVSGTWLIPSFAPDSPAGADAIWVGIGGVHGNDLIQAGTQETVSGHGSTQYAAWIETLPQASHPVPLVVNAGDSVTISIERQDGDTWRVRIANNTTTQTYQTDVQYRSSQSSAEWIVEAPSARRGRLLPLDTFGSVSFSQASATKDSQSVTIAQAGGKPVSMIGRVGHALARPSPLDTAGTSFTVEQAPL